MYGQSKRVLGVLVAVRSVARGDLEQPLQRVVFVGDETVQGRGGLVSRAGHGVSLDREARRGRHANAYRWRRRRHESARGMTYPRTSQRTSE